MERLGSSPLTFKRPRQDQPLSLTIKHNGYREVSRDVVPDRDRDVEVVLVPKPKVVSVPPAHPPPSRCHSPRTPVAQPPRQSKRVSDLRNPFE